MSFVENATRCWKEKTGTVRENTRNAFAGRAKPRDPLFFLPLLYAFNYSSSNARLYFRAEICIIVYCYYKNAFLFIAHSQSTHLY